MRPEYCAEALEVLGTITREFFGYSDLTPVNLVACLSLLIFINPIETRVQEGATYSVLEPFILLKILLSLREPRNATIVMCLFMWT